MTISSPSETMAALHSTATMPELDVRVLGRLLRYVRNHFGDATLEQILTESGIPEHEGGDWWVSVARFKAVLRGVRDGFREAPSRSGVFARCSGTKFGSYALVRLLGKGGTGAVYEAEHRWLRRRVALKILRAQSVAGACDERDVERFLREGRAAARVRHPHVVEVFDFGFDEGSPFLAMELVEGETMQRLLAREGSLSPSRAAELLLPILSALSELHAVGILHRDINPGNILLGGRNGRIPKLSDFGLSRLDDGSAPATQTDVIVGTPGYVAPELAGGSASATDRSDQYAIGVILYECITGERPFQGRTFHESLRAAIYDEICPPSTCEPSVPRAFDDVVLRAMAREPERRFASIGELAEALLPFASEETSRRWRSEFVPEPRR
jgi:serine/threonine protein kinase